MKHKNLLSKRAFLSFIVIFIITAASSFVYTQSAAPREEKLLNGLKLLMFDAPSGDKVTLKVRIHAGSAFDPQGKKGLMKLLAANVFPNPEAKEYFADKLGGSLDVESNYDYIQINCIFKAREPRFYDRDSRRRDREHGKRQRGHGKAQRKPA